MKKVQVRNQQGQPVDWWFIYKTPEKTGREQNNGFDFFYYDSASAQLDLASQSLAADNQALANTLKSIYSLPESAGYISYNDEHVNPTHNQGEKGHCKGIIAFDKPSNSAVLLLHSTPRYPINKQLSFPDDERIYGQTFIAITLPDYATANRIAKQMLHQQNPQVLVESSRIPSSLSNDEPLRLLYNGEGIAEQERSSTLEFKSLGGKAFKLMAKSRKWGRDFWLDLIAPELKCDLVVETWRRGKVTPMQDGLSTEFDEDVMSLKFQLSGAPVYQWKYTKDHAKWAVALKNKTSQLPWVCVGDINRMVSQEKRGGGAICFQEEPLWQALQQAEAQLHQPA